jgi:predicted site-specific integrase-resolvase
MNDIKTNITDLMTDKDRLLPEKQVCKILNVSFETLRQSIRSKGKIQYYKINSKVMYKVSDVLDYLDRCKIEPTN